MTDTTKSYRKIGEESFLYPWPVAAFYLEDRKLRISVARVGDDVYAFDDLCPHDKSSLAQGRLESDTVIMCQCSGCRFDIRTGKVLKGPAEVPLGVYPARVYQGEVQVSLPDET